MKEWKHNEFYNVETIITHLKKFKREVIGKSFNILLEQKQ